MRLLRYEGYKVVAEPEILALKPFREIWERDGSPGKEEAVREIAFVYFFADPRSDYQYIVDRSDREAAIRKGEGMPRGWRPDRAVKAAIELYEGFKPTSALLLEDTRFAVDKLRRMLREIDLSATDGKGKPIYTLSMVTSTIKQIPSLVRDLDEAEKALARELGEAGRVRGGGDKSVMEDSLDI